MQSLKKIGGGMLALALIVTSFAFAHNAHATTPNWNTSGSYIVNMVYLGNNYSHDMALTQDSSGNLTGHGGSPAGANVYTWVITSGTVSGNTIDFLANYTATADAVTPQTVLHVNGTIANNGTMSGTWSDNYMGGSRSGTWSTTSGNAVAVSATLNAEDFGVVNYNTGTTGQLAGYTAGFGLTNGTLAGATSVVVKLYNGTTLLQTNTAILPKFNADITGTQFSSPFDVSGNFQYATDGYWTNVRESQYGQSLPATRVVATVTLASGQVVTAENTNLTGDPTTIYPTVTNYMLNVVKAGTGVGTVTSSPTGINCGSDCSESYASNTSVTLSAVAASGSTFTGWSGACTGTSSCVLTMSAAKNVTATFALNNSNDNKGNANECKNGGWKTFTNPTYKNQGQCVSSHNHENKNHEDQNTKGQNDDNQGEND